MESTAYIWEGIKLYTEDRQFEQKMREATARIPFYSKDWTNRFESDPGMTILENLMILLMLLDRQTEEVPEAIQKKLLELLDIRKQEGKSAKVYLIPKTRMEGRKIPAHQKFYTGQLCFETLQEEILMPGKLKKIFRERNGKFIELEELAYGNPLSVKLFGGNPQKGDALCLLFDFLPSDFSKPLYLYATVKSRFPRNPPDGTSDLEFAKARWSYFTGTGFREMACEDSTGVFLRSGEIKLRLGREAPKRISIGLDSGYIIRCELTCAQYDISPEAVAIDGPLLEVYEMDSKALSYTAKAGEKLYIPPILGEEAYTWIYEKDADGYHLCETQDMEKERKAVCIRKELMPYRDLGILYGYDQEEFDVGMPGLILPESLELMAVQKQGGLQAERAAFFRLDRENPGDEHPLIFQYDAEKGSIQIIDPGDYTGWRLLISACSFYHGKEGNILAHNTFTRTGDGGQEIYENPNPGTGGQSPEGFAELRQKLLRQLKTPEAAVTAKDYEFLVRQVPNLCIHKVHAYTGKKEREAVIAVKPYSEDGQPALSPYYRQCIAGYLEERRLIHTSFRIQSPAYIPVDVWMIVFVKMQYHNCSEQIEGLLRQELDYVNGTGTFGARIELVKLLKKIENLPCVEYVRDFCLNGERKDLILPDHGLAYAGTIKLEVKRNEIV